MILISTNKNKGIMKISLFLLIFMGVVFFVACSDDEKKEESKEAVEETNKSTSSGGGRGFRRKQDEYNINAKTVTLGSIYRRINIDGDVTATDSANVTPDAGGTLHSLQVEEGDTVRKGQVIAQVDPSKPGQKFLLSPVKAPISGTVSTIFIKVGNPVGQSSVIAEIADNSELIVELYIPERYASEVDMGTKGTLSLISFPNEVFPLKARTVSSVLSTVTHTMKVTLSFEKRDKRIKSGMFGTIELILEEIENVPFLRRDYIVQRYFDEANNTGVFKVVEDMGKTTSEFQKVVLGVEDGDYYEIKEGIAEGDVIVITGQERLVNGAALRILEIDGKAQARPQEGN